MSKKQNKTKKNQPLKYLQSPEGNNYQPTVMNPGHMLLRSKSGNIKHASLIEACQIVTKSRVLESVLPLQRLRAWSCQEWRFQVWFVMASSEIKTNIQKWETKDEPQTNDIYKWGK